MRSSVKEPMSNHDEIQPAERAGKVEQIRNEIGVVTPSARKRYFEKFLLAALGSIPWVGGFISTMATLKTEAGDLKADDLRTQWLKEHEAKLRRLGTTLTEISERFESLGDQIDERIQSEAYLNLVRRAFRTWDQADTEEKRKCAANLVVNAGGPRVCSDDVIRLFIDWLNLYHEAHFAVIREIYHNRGVSRYDIWMQVYGPVPREDSAEADLFRMLIRDLSIGGVIRQERETTIDGHFLRKNLRRVKGHAPTTMESAFEDSKPYELTALGKQFVHYTMTDTVGRLESGNHTGTHPN